MTALSNNTPSTIKTFSDPSKFFDRALQEFARPLTQSGATPRNGYDIIQHDDHYEFQVDVPGFDRNDISVELEDGTLTVSGSRGEEETSGDRVVSRRRKKFTYRWPIGEDMEVEGVSAALDSGVLTIDVPRKDQYVEDGAKQIEIE